MDRATHRATIMITPPRNNNPFFSEIRKKYFIPERIWKKTAFEAFLILNLVPIYAGYGQKRMM